MESLLIQRGRVIDPASGIDHEMDVLLRDGRVAAVAARRASCAARRSKTFNARGAIVAPGLIDMHVHLREPGHSHKETNRVPARPRPPPADLPPSADAQHRPGERFGRDHAVDAGAPSAAHLVNVFPIAAATVGSAGEKLTNFAALKRAGAVAVSDDGKPILDDKVMRDALRSAARASR